MIRRTKFVLVALVAVLMMGIATAAAASAAEMVLPEFKTKEAGKSTSGKTALTVKGGASFKCEKSKDTETPTTVNLGEYTIDFEECSEGGEPCKSTGDAEGTILVSGEYHLVLEIKSEKMLYLILFLLPSPDFLFECPKAAVKKFTVLNTILGLIEPAGVPTKEYKIILTQAGGVQTEKAYENNKGEQVASGLEVSQEGGAQKLGGLEAEKALLKFAANQEILN